VEDVKSFYSENFGPNGASIAIVSSLDKNTIAEKLQSLSPWTGDNKGRFAPNEFPKLENGTLYLIDKPNPAQSEIRIGKRAMTYDATGEYYRARLMNYNLGGAFNSRINLNLREDKGYTYGARSGFSGGKHTGRFTASAGVRADATAASIIEFRKEIEGFYDGGITKDELAFMKNALGQRDARSYETPGQKLSFLSEISEYNLDPSFVDEQNKILANIDSNEINQIAGAQLDLDKMITVVVGDKATILDGLKEISDNIVELDVDGKPVE